MYSLDSRLVSTESAPVPDSDEQPDAPSESVGLIGRRQLRITRGNDLDTVELVDARGRATIELRITGADVKVVVLAADLAIRTTGALSIDAARIDLRGRDGVAVTSGGDVSIDAAGATSVTAQSQALTATRGGIDLTASDDVTLEGERIRLNP